METPPAGFEPATNRLTVDGSTAELQRNDGSEPTANLGGVPPMVCVIVWVVRFHHTHN